MLLQIDRLQLKSVNYLIKKNIYIFYTIVYMSVVAAAGYFTVHIYY